MNTLEKIKNGQKVNVEELFEVVNQYALTSLSVSDNDQNSIEMPVNRFEVGEKKYRFSQDTLPNIAGYSFKKDVIQKCDGKWLEESKTVLVTCTLVNGNKINLIIYTEGGRENRHTEQNGFVEEDVRTVKLLLDKGNNTFAFAEVRDVFGMRYEKYGLGKSYVYDYGDELMLKVGDYSVVLYDDGCNYFYVKDTEKDLEIVIKPFGQPFTVITLYFIKQEDEECV